MKGGGGGTTKGSLIILHVYLKYQTGFENGMWGGGGGASQTPGSDTVLSFVILYHILCSFMKMTVINVVLQHLDITWIEYISISFVCPADVMVMDSYYFSSNVIGKFRIGINMQSYLSISMGSAYLEIVYGLNKITIILSKKIV